MINDEITDEMMEDTIVKICEVNIYSMYRICSDIHCCYIQLWKQFLQCINNVLGNECLRMNYKVSNILATIYMKYFLRH